MDDSVSDTGCSNRQAAIHEGAPSPPAPQAQVPESSSLPGSLCQSPQRLLPNPLHLFHFGLQSIQTHYRPAVNACLPPALWGDPLP